MSALTLTNVTYKYKNAINNAVSDISCTFEEGNVYAIEIGRASCRERVLRLV